MQASELSKVASKRVLAYLNTLYRKDAAGFAKQFHPKAEWPFLVVLPGAHAVQTSPELIKKHKAWFENPHCRFVPLRKPLTTASAEAAAGEFGDEDLENCRQVTAEHYQCGARAHVIKQQALGDGRSKLETVKMYLHLQFVHDGKGNWWPTVITNTPIADEAPAQTLKD